MQQNIFATGEKGTAAVKKLRQQKLSNGLPFMINAKELASNQCYMEYPDGSIKLAVHIAGTHDISIIRQLTTAEVSNLRNRFQFSSGN